MIASLLATDPSLDTRDDRRVAHDCFSCLGAPTRCVDDRDDRVSRSDRFAARHRPVLDTVTIRGGLR